MNFFFFSACNPRAPQRSSATKKNMRKSNTTHTTHICRERTKKVIYLSSLCFDTRALSLSIYDAANTSVRCVFFINANKSLSSFLSFLPCCLWRGGGKED
jgi:hypothetical protein